MTKLHYENGLSITQEPQDSSSNDPLIIAIKLVFVVDIKYVNTSAFKDIEQATEKVRDCEQRNRSIRISSKC